MAETDKPLVNRVTKSPLVTIDLERYAPDRDIVEFDIKEFLWQGLVLKEKDFREDLKTHDWSAYQDKIIAVYCSVDAIIPTWAYMLVASGAQPFASQVFAGTKDEYLKCWFEAKLADIDPEDYRDGLIVVKGCGTGIVPQSAYTALVMRLQPVVKSLMYGEPCSTVPVYKRPKKV